MALHNIDKTSEDRGAPTPNTHDLSFTTIAPIVDTARPSHGTNSVNYLTPGQSPQTKSGLFNAQKTLVQTGTIEVSNDGSPVTVSSFAHNLGYAPLMESSVNAANLTDLPGLANIQLPTWLQAALSGGQVQFISYLSFAVDATNIYYYLLNASNGPLNLDVTYYLYQQRQEVIASQ